MFLVFPVSEVLSRCTSDLYSQVNIINCEEMPDSDDPDICVGAPGEAYPTEWATRVCLIGSVEWDVWIGMHHVEWHRLEWVDWAKEWVNEQVNKQMNKLMNESVSHLVSQSVSQSVSWVSEW